MNFLIYGLRLELTMDDYSKFTLAATAGGAISGCTISEVEFVGQVVELDAGPQSLIEAQNPQKLLSSVRHPSALLYQLK